MLRCLDGPPTVTNVTTTRRWTYADYCRIPADRRRHEIVDARQFVTPSPSPRHQDVALRLAAQFLRTVESTSRPRVRGPARRASRSRHDRAARPGRALEAPPFDRRPEEADRRARPAVEILSPSHRTHDTVRKRERYQRAGVRELWWSDACTVTQLVLRKGRYALVATATDTIAARALRGVHIDLTDVFA